MSDRLNGSIDMNKLIANDDKLEKRLSSLAGTLSNLKQEITKLAGKENEIDIKISTVADKEKTVKSAKESRDIAQKEFDKNPVKIKTNVDTDIGKNGKQGTDVAKTVEKDIQKIANKVKVNLNDFVSMDVGKLKGELDKLYDSTSFANGTPKALQKFVGLYSSYLAKGGKEIREYRAELDSLIDEKLIRQNNNILSGEKTPAKLRHELELYQYMVQEVNNLHSALENVAKIQEEVTNPKAKSGNQTEVSSDTTASPTVKNIEKVQEKLAETRVEAEKTSIAIEQATGNQTPLSSESKTAEKAKETSDSVKQANDKIIASNEEVAASEEKVRKYRLANRDSIPKLKATADSSNEASNMKEVATSTDKAVKAKKEFATANEKVQGSVDGSKSKLQLEAELMESIAQNAREAAKAKKEFAEANELVQKSVNGTQKSTKADKYKDKNKVSEDNYTSKSGYYASIANEKLLASGNTILGGSTSTELVNGLVKVSAKIKTADNTWKTFSAKIDADGNMFEQRFRTIAKGVDKLERELADFESGSKPALTYGETLEKANQIRKSLNLGDDYSIKVDSNELVTITKRLKDVDSSTSSVTQTFKSAQDAIENFGKEASSAAEKTSVAMKSTGATSGKTGDTGKKTQSATEIDEITEAYRDLINTEKEYQTLKTKASTGHELTEREENRLSELEAKREKANKTLKKQTELTEKQAQASREYAEELERVSSLMSSGIANREKHFLREMQGEFNAIDVNKKDFQYDSSYEAELEKLRGQLKELDSLAKNLEFADDKDIQRFIELRQAAESALDSIKAKTNNLQFKTPDVEDVRKKMVEIQKIMNQNTKMPREMKETFEALQQKYQLLIDTKGSVSQFKILNGELEEMKFNLQKSGKIGKSFFTQIGTSLKSMNSRLIAYYFSMYDFIRYARQIFTTIKEYDAALTEMNKVSDESINTLKQFQKESFALANSVGTVASQIQNSTADFLRLGESFEQAKESAQAANALFKVSEFSDISEATDALIAMSQAYKELDKSEINDILNYTGNNFSISTAELASALQRSSATLKVAGNDIYEATALVTAGNAVLQDAETVGAGLKMISLRILGTQEAKDELASLGENVDDFVVQTQSKIDETVRKYTAVASNDFKGISILDDNGNYKSTYEILRDISQIYQEILDTDKKAGTNRGQALLEVLAGKNRSNVAASILQNPELLTSVYEETLTKSQGSVAKEMESQLASIESHLNTLKNTWDSLWINDNNREVINFFLDLATGILKAVDKIGVFNSALIGLGAGIGIKKLNAGGGRAK